jgi:hypothetical protein
MLCSVGGRSYGFVHRTFSSLKRLNDVVDMRVRVGRHQHGSNVRMLQGFFGASRHRCASFGSKGRGCFVDKRRKR